eukprot:COSAG06_NODE_38128_length_427_cov_0.625000_1_plen_106_part_00
MSPGRTRRCLAGSQTSKGCALPPTLSARCRPLTLCNARAQDMFGLIYQRGKEYDIADSDALICKIVFAMFLMGMLVSTVGGIPLTMSVPVLGSASVTLFLLTLYC